MTLIKPGRAAINRSRKAGAGDPRLAYFDESFYKEQYGPTGDAFEHYITGGWKCGNMPNAFFDPAVYGEFHQLDGQEPLAHLVSQMSMTTFCSPAFDRAGYRERYPDVANAEVEPLAHFLTYGLAEKRLPGFDLSEFTVRKQACPHFDWTAVENIYSGPQRDHLGPANDVYRTLIDAEFYRVAYGDHLHGDEPANHFATKGWRLGFRPNPFFDPRWYARQHGLGTGQDPLSHHVLTGYNPVPFLCVKSYIRANPEAAYERSTFAHLLATAAKGQCELGLDGLQVDALRRVHRSYDWSFAEQADILPLDTEICPAFPSPAKDVATPAPRRTPNKLLLATFLQRAERAKVLTFDVWDTLLRRTCHPDELKLYAAGVLLQEVGGSFRGGRATAADLFRLRQLAEFRVADEHYEYTHAAMMDEWLRLLGIFDGAERARIAAIVTEAEITREIAVTRPDPTAAAMLAALPHIPKIAISDFYLPCTALERILDHHGLLHHLRSVHVSCDVMLTKREGRLFDHVLAAERIAPNDVLHVGDNAHADVAVATARGLAALLFTDDIEDRRKVDFAERFQALLAGDGTAIMVDILGRPVDAEGANACSSDPRADGTRGEPLSVSAQLSASSVEFLAMAFAGFGMFILERALAAGFRTIFFATREGVFFKRVCELLAEHDLLGALDYPEMKLVEVSRRATFAASLREVSTREMMRLWSQYSVQSMKAFCLTLNVDEKRMAEFCAFYGIDVSEPVKYPWQDSRVIAMFDDPAVRDWLAGEILEQKAELLAYLEVAGFEPHTPRDRFFVDIGWRGSIQDNLSLLCEGRIEGAYMALYRYLAVQPANVVKHGFLIDHNSEESTFHVGDFAALEFVANGSGGSVAGYAGGVALRDSSPHEEEFIASNILPLQDKILSTIIGLVPTLRGIPLSGDTWAMLGRQAVNGFTSHPDVYIADMFQRLTHNESFGVGEVIDMEREVDKKELATLDGAELHALMREKLSRIRWPQAWLRATDTQDFISMLPLDRKLALPRIPGLAQSPALIRGLGHKVSIFAPAPIWGSGGHRTIYNFAKALDRAGYDVNLFSEFRGEIDYKEQELSRSNVKIHDSWCAGFSPSVAIATVSYSAEYVANFFSDSVHKFYFVQDFEAAFNPVSDGYVRGENTFALGHNHICVGRWLPHVIRAQFGQGSAGGGLGVDTGIYRLDPKVDRRKRIAVLYQPEKWRRLPEICLEALTLVKARMPDTEVVFYGSDQVPSTAWTSTHLGLMDDLQELNRLYNSAQVGLCVSLTNPSRVPFEMMAAGCVPVDVYRYNNLFDFPDGTGLLGYQSAQSLAATMLHLLEDEAECSARRENCARIASRRTLDWEVDVAVNAVEHVLKGGLLSDMPVPTPSYTAGPFLAIGDDTAPVRAWCDWQAKMAGCV